MSTLSTVSESYTERESQLVVMLTAGILFLEGLVITYQLHLKEVYEDTFSLSTFEWAIRIYGPILVEPVLLFGTLYYVGSRFDRPIPLLRLLPGLAVAVIIGGILGQYVGGPPTPLRGGIGVGIPADPTDHLYLQPVWEPLLRDMLTAVAALGFAQTRGADTDKGSD